MRKLLLAAVVSLCAVGSAVAAPVTPGNIVVSRVGTGDAALSNAATAVFLDEYTPTGTLVQSIALPTAVTAANRILTASGTATSELQITLSGDGRYVAVTGYDAAPGTATVASSNTSTVARTIGIVDLTTGTVNTSTTTTQFNANNIRSAYTSDGTNIWAVGGNSGVQFTTLGSTSSTNVSNTVANLRVVNAFGGQLYTSTASGTAVRLGTVGTGLPTTSGETITNLPGFLTSTGSPYGFYFADLSSSVAGVDTLYVADDAAVASGGGIRKYSLVGGSWQSNGTLGIAGLRGLSATLTGTELSLVGTSSTDIFAFTDASGYNGAISGSATSIVTAGANTAFRGIVATSAAAAAVPEVGTFSLLGMGALPLIGAVVARRRSRKAA